MPQSSSKPFSGIFISYRRTDSSGHAGRLFDKLVDHFGKDRIFMDIDAIEAGEDFVTVIEDAVASCDILIAVIGRNWLLSTTERLNDSNDFVRVEIATALRRSIRVIPILVQRASMPKQQELPESLEQLARRNAIELSDRDWQNDVRQLIGVMDRILVSVGKATWQGEAVRNAEAETPALSEEERRKVEKRTSLGTEHEGGQAGTGEYNLAVHDFERQRVAKRENRRKRTILLAIGASVALLGTVVFIGIMVLFWMMKRPVAEEPIANRNAGTQPSGQITSAPSATAVQPPLGMVYVPGGEFMMGRSQSDGGDEYEHPAHKVTVRPFFIDVHEVTCEEYDEFIHNGHPAPSGWVNSKVPKGAARKPVTNVKWDDADAYCNEYGKRLPREEEWELAARGTKGYIYPWGNVWEARLANIHTRDLTEVGKFPGSSPYGAVDMVGNAWEWTASPLTPYPNGTLSEQPPPDSKVIRGGSYIDYPDQATTTYRVGYPARNATDYSKIGFRCVSDVTPTFRPRQD